jgi:hypothetical protein
LRDYNEAIENVQKRVPGSDSSNDERDDERDDDHDIMRSADHSAGSKPHATTTVARTATPTSGASTTSPSRAITAATASSSTPSATAVGSAPSKQQPHKVNFGGAVKVPVSDGGSDDDDDDEDFAFDDDRPPMPRKPGGLLSLPVRQMQRSFVCFCRLTRDSHIVLIAECRFEEEH